MTVLVDSDILIEVSRGRNPQVASQWNELSESTAAVLFSPVSAAELWAGVRPSEHTALTDLFAGLVCAPIDAMTGRQAGDFMRRYRKSHNLELADALIAAAALSNGATLWTRNRKYYPMKELAFFS